MRPDGELSKEEQEVWDILKTYMEPETIEEGSFYCPYIPLMMSELHYELPDKAERQMWQTLSDPDFAEGLVRYGENLEQITDRAESEKISDTELMEKLNKKLRKLK